VKRFSIALTVALAVVARAGIVTGQAPAKPAAPTAAPVVRASVDRTAIWIGDHVTYTIEVVSPRGYDVLEDDLSKDKLKLEGLDVVSTDTSRAEDPGGGATRRFRYVLAAYKLDTPALTIAPLSVRYYATRAGQRLEDSAPVGAVEVPAAVIALRSTLPDAQASFALRDARPSAGRPRLFAMARPIGLGLVAVSVVPAVVWGIALVTRRRHRKPGRSVRQVRRDERASLAAVRELVLGSPVGRRDAFTQIDRTVREHLREVHGVAGPSLTPAEVGPALAGRSTRIPAESIASLLAACEAGRYAPPRSLPSEDACRDALAQAEALLAMR
jgi:hypothetical protein